MDIDLYETDFPGMYMTEDGFMVSESGDIYDQEGNLLEEDAVMMEGKMQKKILKHGTKISSNGSKIARNAMNFAKNNKGKVALGVAGTVAAAYGAKKAYNYFKGKNKKTKSANESFDLYETEMPGIYVTEDGYFVDTDGSLYDQNGDLIEENAVSLNEIVGLTPMSRERIKKQSKNAANIEYKIADKVGKGANYVKGKLKKYC